MKRIGTVGLCVATIAALGAVFAQGAQALYSYGVCGHAGRVLVGRRLHWTGLFSENKCATVNPFHEGAWEWYPGVPPIPGYTSKSKAVIITPPAGEQIECRKSTDVGVITSAVSDSDKIEFENCALVNNKRVKCVITTEQMLTYLYQPLSEVPEYRWNGVNVEGPFAVFVPGGQVWTLYTNINYPASEALFGIVCANGEAYGVYGADWGRMAAPVGVESKYSLEFGPGKTIGDVFFFKNNNRAEPLGFGAMEMTQEIKSKADLGQ